MGLETNAIMKLIDYNSLRNKVITELVRREELFKDWKISISEAIVECEQFKLKVDSLYYAFLVKKDEDEESASQEFYCAVQQLLARDGRNLVDIALQICDIDLYKRKAIKDVIA